MSRYAFIILSTALVALPCTARACNSLAETEAKLSGRAESVSADDRSEVKDPLGLVRIGCRGNTFAATVRAGTASVTQDGDKIKIEFPYSGRYERDKFDVPCVKVANEGLDVGGIFTMVAVKPFIGNMQIVSVGVTNPSPIGDAGHDSNRYAMAAARQIIAGACGF